MVSVKDIEELERLWWVIRDRKPVVPVVEKSAEGEGSALWELFDL